MNSILRFNLILFLFSLVLNLSIPWDHSKWYGLGDPPDYLHQSKIPLTEMEFFFPHKVPGFYPRPFTVPFFYKIAWSNPDNIIVLQRLIHTITIFILAYALAIFLKNVFLKYIIIFLVYFLMSWWNILGWSSILLSESLSISFMFLWIATFLLFLKNKIWYNFLLHLVIVLLFSFTRDTWPYILTVFYLLLLIITYLYSRDLIKWIIPVLASCLIIFIVQNRSSSIGNRTKLPLMNTILVRILPDANYLSWMQNKGMPMAERLHQEFKDIDIKNDSCRIKVYEFYNDTTYNHFFNWVNTKGKRTYINFMITHPGYFFLFKESRQDLKRIFAYNLFEYTGSVKGYSFGANYVFPLFNLVSIIILVGIIILIFRKSKKIIHILPSVYFIILICNIFLTYNADALEVERHLFITHIFIQFIGIYSVMLIFDYYFAK